MTTPGPRDPATLSDPRVDAAWRALSGEEPPKVLDAAILAAARREVGAKPRRMGTLEGWAADRRWWPLAAAATVAAIAVGVLQLTTPDQLGAPAPDKTIVTDMPTPTAAPVPGTAAPPSAAETKSESRVEVSAGSAASRADVPRRPASPSTTLAPEKQTLATPPTAAVPEPFPAAPPPAAPIAAAPIPAGKLAASAPTKESAPTLAATANAPAASASPPRDSAASLPIATAPAPALAPALAPAPAPPPTPAARAAAERVSEGVAVRPSPLAKRAAGHATDAGADEARAKDLTPLPIADWIVLIRRLRDQGKSADAAKELAAFRAAHVDHAKLLPPDLRDWRPPEK
jgi:hypothetical protein